MKSIMCLRNLLENITESLEDSTPIFNDIKSALILIECFLLVNQIFLFDNWLKFVTQVALFVTLEISINKIEYILHLRLNMGYF